MLQDTISYDSLDARPLPQWLIKQRDGLNIYEPPKLEMQEDNTLRFSLILTGVIILLVVVLLTIWFFKRYKKKQ